MRCPFCATPDSRVIDSRLAGDGDQIRRRRECQTCGERFTTFEVAELVLPRVVKRDGSRVPFDPDKLRGGMMQALHKRPVATERVEEALSRVLHRAQTLGEREVSARAIGDWVMDELRGLDQVAYVRFASIYRDFQDVQEFRDEIERLESLPSAEQRRQQLDLLPGGEPRKKRG